MTLINIGAWTPVFPVTQSDIGYIDFWYDNDNDNDNNNDNNEDDDVIWKIWYVALLNL